MNGRGGTPSASDHPASVAVTATALFTPLPLSSAGHLAGFGRRAPLRVRPHGGKAMTDCTLQVGDEVLLHEGTRLTLLAVEGDTVCLGITAPAGAQVVGPEAPATPAVRRAGLSARPGSN